MNSMKFRNVALVAAAWTLTAASNASVVTHNLNVLLPAGIDGYSLNFWTGQPPIDGSYPWHFTFSGGPSITCYAGNAYVRLAGTGMSPSNLALGTFIGNDSGMEGGGPSAVFGSGLGEWAYNSTNYVGFRFVRDGLNRYAFARIDMGAASTNATLVYVSFESEAGVGITVTPAPGAIALLGLAGLAGRRRRD